MLREADQSINAVMTSVEVALFIDAHRMFKKVGRNYLHGLRRAVECELSDQQ